MPLADAIGLHVRDGQTLALEGFTHLIPTAAGHEIIRQRRKDLTLIRMTPDIVYDQMIGMGCASRLEFSWGGNPGVGSLHRFRDAIENAWPNPVAIRGAQPRRHGGPLPGRRLGPAVLRAARLHRLRPAEAQHEHPRDHLPVHRRDARRDAGDQPRRHDHPRAEGRPEGQRARARHHRRAEGSGARGQGGDRHRRGDRRRTSRRR